MQSVAKQATHYARLNVRLPLEMSGRFHQLGLAQKIQLRVGYLLASLKQASVRWESAVVRHCGEATVRRQRRY